MAANASTVSLLDEPEQQRLWISVIAGLIILSSFLIGKTWLKPNPLANVPIIGKGSRWARRKHFLQGNATEMFLDAYRNVGCAHQISQKKLFCRIFANPYLPAQHKDSISIITTAKSKVDSLKIKTCSG